MRIIKAKKGNPRPDEQRVLSLAAQPAKMLPRIVVDKLRAAVSLKDPRDRHMQLDSVVAWARANHPKYFKL